MRLSATATKLEHTTARFPNFVRGAHGTGIVHLGLGAFARAHLAYYTQAAIERSGGNWRIVGASLRGTDVADALNAQDGRYTLIERGRDGTRADMIDVIDHVIAGPDLSQLLLEALTSADCRIVSISVTEKGYGIRASGGCDPDHPAIRGDLEKPDLPKGVIGLIARALELRFAAGTPPFTVLSCDNLPDNGAQLHLATIDFARRSGRSHLAQRIAEDVAFPSTMVDRITPASTDQTFADALALTGYEDLAAVETESFSQWVIEDKFPLGRPDWEAAGALFVPQVNAYEQMKLRMLNGSHSLLAYSGFLSGHRYVRDVMGDAALSKLIERHLKAAAGTLPKLAVDLSKYANDLLARFANPAIAHETRQIASDGSQKMPPRIFEAALAAMDRKQDLASFAFATAAWMRYLTGIDEQGQSYPIIDPRAGEISAALAGARNATQIFAGIAAMADLMPQRLAKDAFAKLVIARLETIQLHGMKGAIERELI